MLIPLCIVFVLLLLLLVPLRVRVWLRMTLSGGAGVLTLRFLLLRHTLHFRIHALDEPPFSLELIRSDGKIKLVSWGNRKKRRSVDSAALIERVRFRRLDCTWRIGIAASPAATALLCGLAREITEQAARILLGGRKHRDVRIAAQPDFYRDACFFTLSGIAAALPAQIIREILKQKRREKTNASD